MDEYAYGCIPFNRDDARQLQALLVLRAKGFWEFPKGKVEEGESPEACAQRELKEETGLEGELQVEQPITIRYTFERDGSVIRKQVTFYFCRVPDGSIVEVDKREVNDYRWLPLEELADRATYPEMKEVARKAWHTLAD